MKKGSRDQGTEGSSLGPVEMPPDGVGGGGTAVLDGPLPASETETALVQVDAVVDANEMTRQRELHELAGLEEELVLLGDVDAAENAARALYNSLLEEKRRVLGDFDRRVNEAKDKLGREADKANGPRTRRENVRARINVLAAKLRPR